MGAGQTFWLREVRYGRTERCSQPAVFQPGCLVPIFRELYRGQLPLGAQAGGGFPCEGLAHAGGRRVQREHCGGDGVFGGPARPLCHDGLCAAGDRAGAAPCFAGPGVGVPVRVRGLFAEFQRHPRPDGGGDGPVARPCALGPERAGIPDQHFYPGPAHGHRHAGAAETVYAGGGAVLADPFAAEKHDPAGVYARQRGSDDPCLLGDRAGAVPGGYPGGDQRAGAPGPGAEGLAPACLRLYDYPVPVPRGTLFEKKATF